MWIRKRGEGEAVVRVLDQGYTFTWSQKFVGVKEEANRNERAGDWGNMLEVWS